MALWDAAFDVRPGMYSTIINSPVAHYAYAAAGGPLGFNATDVACFLREWADALEILRDEEAGKP